MKPQRFGQGIRSFTPKNNLKAYAKMSDITDDKKENVCMHTVHIHKPIRIAFVFWFIVNSVGHSSDVVF